MKRLTLILALCLSASAQVTVFRVDPQSVMTTAGITPPFGNPQLYAVAGAIIEICTDTACATPATTYIDVTGTTTCPSHAQVTLAGTDICQGSTGSRGEFGFWLPAGIYYYTVAPLGTSTVYGPYPITVASGGGGGGGGNVSGTGTPPCLPLWATSSTLGTSNICDTGSVITLALPTVIGGTGQSEFGFYDGAGSPTTPVVGQSPVCATLDGVQCKIAWNWPVLYGTPASSSAACTQGQMKFDSAFIYTCVATNTWRRTATSSF